MLLPRLVASLLCCHRLSGARTREKSSVGRAAARTAGTGETGSHSTAQRAGPRPQTRNTEQSEQSNKKKAPAGTARRRTSPAPSAAKTKGMTVSCVGSVSSKPPAKLPARATTSAKSASSLGSSVRRRSRCDSDSDSQDDLRGAQGYQTASSAVTSVHRSSLSPLGLSSPGPLHLCV
jgi:hypothetical protein